MFVLLHVCVHNHSCFPVHCSRYNKHSNIDFTLSSKLRFWTRMNHNNFVSLLTCVESHDSFCIYKMLQFVRLLAESCVYCVYIVLFFFIPWWIFYRHYTSINYMPSSTNSLVQESYFCYSRCISPF